MTFDAKQIETAVLGISVYFDCNLLRQASCR